MATITVTAETNGFSVNIDNEMYSYNKGQLVASSKNMTGDLVHLALPTGKYLHHFNIASDTLDIGGVTSFANAAALIAQLDKVIAAAPGASNVIGKVDKFGFNKNVQPGSYVLISSYGGTFDETNIMTTEQTYTIAYNNTTDGATATGARILQFTHIKDVDGVITEVDEIHILGSSGSDVTTFSGLGINRVIVVDFGGDAKNGDDITITATTDGTTQAQIEVGTSVTEQLLYHTPENVNFNMTRFYLTFRKTSGGGVPKLDIRLNSYSRITGGIYNVRELSGDTQRGNELDPSNFNADFGGREVIFVDVQTDTANTAINGSFGGELTVA
ncbi:MAG: hypothetical protein HRT61_00860 [Ekhidna sp.]|nr:hypothetical protein [Ekhidna sp.]